ncbi:MAG: SDR family oxidoreductase [Acidobacteria bacterium]|nr:SDR family oxidoreductase [Acidobacteriota bacterium]
MLLTNKVAVLVGARRMGLALATALASRGADVALTYRTSPDAAEAAADAVSALGRKAMVVRCDVTDETPVVEATFQQVADEMGRLDVLVMMASRYVEAHFDDLDTWEIERTLGVDMRGTFVCMRAAIPHMRRAGGGRIINFTDWTAASGRPRYKGYTGYYVAKAGVKALTEAFALELAGERILVNAIAPGPVLAPDDFSPEQRAGVEAATPVGRWGGADEVAKAVLALIDSDFMTGETIRVDGGRHLR